MIRAMGATFILVILLPAFAAAQEPKAKLPAVKPPAAKPPPPKEQPAAKLPAVDPSAQLPAVMPTPKPAVLTARLHERLLRSRTIRIGSVRWACRGETCTTTDLSGKAPEVSACHELRQQVGVIETFGDDKHGLTRADLRRCNRPPLDPAAGQVVFGDGQPGVRLPAVRPTPELADQVEEPGEKMPTEGDVPEIGLDGGGAAPEPSDAGSQPEPFMQPKVARLSEISAGPKDAPIEPEQIANLPSPVEFRAPSSFPISGRITINACGASLENIAVRLVRETPGDGPSLVFLDVGPDPYNDLQFRFEGRVSPGVYEVTPQLAAAICPGSWSPGSYSIRVSEVVGSPGAPRSDYDFTYTNVPLTITRIPALILTSVIEDLFDGTEIRLNNRGRGNRRGSWYKPDDSWIRLPDALGGLEMPVDLLPAQSGVLRYYVNDVNLSSVSVRRRADVVAIILRFESVGVELKGYCWGTNLMIDFECLAGPDDSAPDVHIDNLRVSILLPPARFVPDRGTVAISYGDPRVMATADIQARGVCELVDVCSLLVDYEELILTGIEERLESLLAQRGVRQTVAEGISAAMASSGYTIGDVNSVGFEGSNLVIRHRPR